jgi:hypothetical protein
VFPNVREYFKEILSDAQEGYSSKRFVGLGAFILASMGFVASWFGIHIVESLYNGLLMLSGTSLGLTVPEWFSPIAKSQATVALQKPAEPS